ncbi:MAG TPA: diguanylate cyclase [Gemmatimonadota bacterium]|nr:diguanylate cyclase [Gemmatimonadota bacterium]
MITYDRALGAPPRSLLISGIALAVPLLAEGFFPEYASDYQILLWLLALVPAFLLAYHSGWKGAATALAAGMAILTITHLTTIFGEIRFADGPLLLALVTAYIGVSLGIGFLSEQLHRERARAELLAHSDELTGAPNRRAAQIFLEKEFAAAERGRPLTVVMWDLDGFKAYNDRFGHAAGDAALRVFCEVLIGKTRRQNLSSRYGGEEFLSILSSCTAEGATHFVRRVQERLRDAPLAAGPITVSAGIASYGPGMPSPEDLLRAADQALYDAKAGGRDTFRVFGQRSSAEDEKTPQVIRLA